MKLVLLKNIKHGFESVIIVDDDDDDTYGMGDDYLQISEVIDAEFPMIEFDINAAKVKAIDKEISKAEAGIHLLKRTKAELLSIPDMSDE